MSGAIALSQGVLYVARPQGRLRVRAFDLEGRALPGGFALRGLDSRAARVRALAVDADRRVWLADESSRAVRGFSVFGAEIFLWRDELEQDRAGHLGVPVGLAAHGIENSLRLLVASAGERRHALHLVDPAARTASSLRPLGDPNERFRRLAGVALHDDLACACETAAGRVQVFRDGEFHFAFGATAARPDERFEPRAIALLSDGRMLVAHAGETSALLLFDRGGRRATRLAGDGLEEGAVFEPSAVAVHESSSDAESLAAVIDKDGERVQLFSLAGRHAASFVDGSRASV